MSYTPTRDPTLAIIVAMCGDRHPADAATNHANPTYRAYCGLIRGGHSAVEIVAAALAAERTEPETLAACTPYKLVHDVLPRYLLAMHATTGGGQ